MALPFRVCSLCGQTPKRHRLVAATIPEATPPDREDIVGVLVDAGRTDATENDRGVEFVLGQLQPVLECEFIDRQSSSPSPTGTSSPSSSSPSSGSDSSPGSDSTSSGSSGALSGSSGSTAGFAFFFRSSF